MTELWDVYDEQGRMTGLTGKRGEEIPEGQYRLMVDVWVINDQGECLIQKRAAGKKVLPNIWAAHGGGVLAGEDSAQAGVRETAEEIGLSLTPKDLHYLGRLVIKPMIWDMYVAYKDYDIQKAKLQEEEVSAIAWVSSNKLLQMRDAGEFFPYPELDDILRLMKQARQ
jgi:8-oxo-dGTP pyrophosphatase MutT (NUDIX family)